MNKRSQLFIVSRQPDVLGFSLPGIPKKFKVGDRFGYPL